MYGEISEEQAEKAESERADPLSPPPAGAASHVEPADMFELRLYLAEERAALAELELSRVKLREARAALALKYQLTPYCSVDQTTLAILRP